MDSAFAKLGRAEEHLAELQAAINEFHAQDLSEKATVTLADHPSNESLVLLTIRIQMEAPTRWSLIMGDILTNLRAALDHALYGHAEARQQLNAKQRKDLKYPIFAQRPGWDGTPERIGDDGTIIKKATLGAEKELRELVAPEVLNLIYEAQPFHSGTPEWHSLAILNGLVNRDKHRAVFDVPINIAELAVTETNLEILKQTGPVVEPDGSVAVTATVRRPQGAPGAEPSYVPVNFVGMTAFMEQIELPGVNERRPFREVMEKLVKTVRAHLEELKAVGA